MLPMKNRAKRSGDRYDQFSRCSFSFAVVLALLAWFLSGCTGTAAETLEDDRANRLEVAPVDLTGIKARGVDAGEYVFKDSGEWESFRRKHGGGPAPEIDFERDFLVAVFLGQRPNPGYSVRIVGAKKSEGEVVVEVVEYQPSPGMMYAQVLVYPFDAALVPKADGSIRFVTTKKDGRPQANP